jgi:hypothetical protein
MAVKKKLPPHDVGSGNIFVDLGLPNAAELQRKATALHAVQSAAVKPAANSHETDALTSPLAHTRKHGNPV